MKNKTFIPEPLHGVKARTIGNPPFFLGGSSTNGKEQDGPEDISSLLLQAQDPISALFLALLGKGHPKEKGHTGREPPHVE
jgi:hypothetical protein